MRKRMKGIGMLTICGVILAGCGQNGMSGEEVMQESVSESVLEAESESVVTSESARTSVVAEESELEVESSERTTNNIIRRDGIVAVATDCDGEKFVSYEEEDIEKLVRYFEDLGELEHYLGKIESTMTHHIDTETGIEIATYTRIETEETAVTFHAPAIFYLMKEDGSESVVKIMANNIIWIDNKYYVTDFKVPDEEDTEAVARAEEEYDRMLRGMIDVQEAIVDAYYPTEEQLKEDVIEITKEILNIDIRESKFTYQNTMDSFDTGGEILMKVTVDEETAKQLEESVQEQIERFKDEPSAPGFMAELFQSTEEEIVAGEVITYYRGCERTHLFGTSRRHGHFTEAFFGKNPDGTARVYLYLSDNCYSYYLMEDEERE